jgi:hypothetical protein
MEILYFLALAADAQAPLFDFSADSRELHGLDRLPLLFP